MSMTIEQKNRDDVTQRHHSIGRNDSDKVNDDPARNMKKRTFFIVTRKGTEIPPSDMAEKIISQNMNFFLKNYSCRSISVSETSGRHNISNVICRPSTKSTRVAP